MRGRDLSANVALLGGLWFIYSAVRGVTADDLTTAMGNASDLLHLQSVVGLPSELSFQQTVLNRTGLLRVANIYYVAVHFPATLGFLAWAWLCHRDRFSRIRNTLIGVTGVGLVVHVLYPLAPPRMINGFVDTAAVLGPNPYDLRVSAAANQIAAMPSLHVGWALLVAMGIIWILESNWRFVAVAHPAVTVGVVVITANHYWTDAIVAASLVFLGWVAFRRRNRAAWPRAVAVSAPREARVRVGAGDLSGASTLPRSSSPAPMLWRSLL
ncbi:MAG: phosphatase PAP2 family protein [Acidimicrobiales bacterium]